MKEVFLMTHLMDTVHLLTEGEFGLSLMRKKKNNLKKKLMIVRDLHEILQHLHHNSYQSKPKNK